MPEVARKTDVIVIGAGPGGYVAAIRLAQLGKQVIVAEKEALGGVCLNWGCIPSKALIHVAGLHEKIQQAADMGIAVDGLRLDVGRMQQWKDGVVKKLTGGIGQLFKAHGIETVSGTAAFDGPKTLSVKTADGRTQTLEADHFIIATGSSPIEIPGFAFNGDTITESREALGWTEAPKTLAVLGGGVIGLEMATLYARLGSGVTVIELADEVLAGSGVDSEVLQALRRALKKRGIRVLTGTRAIRADEGGNPAETTTPAAGAAKRDGGVEVASGEGTSVTVTYDAGNGEERLTVDKLLVCVGRRPNSQGLGLDKAGVRVDARGFIGVDKQLRTSAPHIFAIGDVVAPPLLAHKASKEGLTAAAVIAGENIALDVRAMPAAIFTEPEIATVGLNEGQAKAAGFDVRIGKFPFAASGRALSMEETEGFVKVIGDAKTDRLLGVHMIGPHVADLIAEATLAIEMGATVEDLSLTVHTHPTLPETLMEAAEAAHNLAIHIYQKEKPPAHIHG